MLLWFYTEATEFDLGGWKTNCGIRAVV